MGLFREYSISASRAINSVLGDLCSYKIRETGQVVPNLSIKITKGKPIKDELGSIYDYRTEASILKEDLPVTPTQYDSITDDLGNKFTVDRIITENSNKWWVNLTESNE